MLLNLSAKRDQSPIKESFSPVAHSVSILPVQKELLEQLLEPLRGSQAVLVSF